MPDAIREKNPWFILRLISGLSGYDESQYREWLLAHPKDRDRSDADEERRLSYHAYTQDTMLLADLRNMMAGLLNSRAGADADGKEIEMILPPGVKEDKPRTATNLSQMRAMFAGMPTA